MRIYTYKYLITTVLIILASDILIAQQGSTSSMTFEEAINITKKQSHVVKQYEYLKQQKEQELKAASGLHYPKIGLSANYVYMSDDIHLDMTPIKDAIAPVYQGLSQFGVFSGVPNPKGGLLPDQMSTAIVRKKFEEGLKTLDEGEWDKILQKQQFATVNLNATLPIYTGGKILDKRKAAKLEIEDAVLEGKSNEDKLTTELVERYFGLCLARQAEQVRKEVLEGMQKHLSDAQKMKEQGLISKAEVLHAKVYNSQAERDLKKAKRLTSISNRALHNTLNDSLQIDITPISALFYVENIQSLEYFQNEALKNNPSIKRVESKKSLAEIGVKVKTSNYLPNIAAFGNYDIWNHDLSESSPKWIVGVGLQWTIFDGLSRDKHRKSALLKLSQVLEFEQKVNNDVQTGVEKYYQELLMSLEQLQELETALEFTSEYKRVKDKAFHEGMASSTDVVDAKLALVKVKIERLQSMYNFDVSLAKLLELCGMSNKFLDYQKSPSAKTETFSN